MSDSPSGESGHFQMGANEIIADVVEHAPRLGAIASFIDRVAGVLKREAQHLSQTVFVFYEEYLRRRHKASSLI